MNECDSLMSKEVIFTKESGEECTKHDRTVEDGQGNGREIVRYERAQGERCAIVSHEKQVVENSNNFIMRLNRLYEMTGIAPNPKDGLLKRLQYLEEVFFGTQSEVKGVFIDRVRLLEEELLSPPE